MAGLVKIEGFDWIDHFSYVYNTSGTPITTSNNTRFSSGRCAQLVSGDQIHISLPAVDSGVLGVAFQMTNPGTSLADIVTLYGGAGDGHFALSIGVDSSSRVCIMDGNGTSIYNSNTNTVSANTWYYLEWQWELADSIDQPTYVRIDGIDWITVTQGSDLKANSPAGLSVNKCLLCGHTNGTTRFDDFYAGVRQSGFFGDMQIVSLVPTGDNTDLNNTWTNNVGNQINNYQYVDETGNPDDDDTYVFTTGDEKLEMYRFSDLGVTANQIFGVELITRSKKSGAGDMFVSQSFLDPDHGVVHETGYTQLSASYGYTRTLLEWVPRAATSEHREWTSTAVNNLHFGSTSYTGLKSTHGF